VELFEHNENGKPRLFGDDTKTTVTILDEDFPGTLGFEVTEITAHKSQERVDIVVTRTEGNDGRITCTFKTEPMIDPNASSTAMAGSNAIEFEHYLPKHDVIEFLHGECEKVISIFLVTDKVHNIEGKGMIEDDEEKPAGEEEEEEPHDLMFKVKLEKAEPEAIKISKKNICIVSISQSSEDVGGGESQAKLVDYFIKNKKPTFFQQFKTAVTLAP